MIFVSNGPPGLSFPNLWPSMLVLASAALWGCGPDRIELDEAAPGSEESVAVRALADADGSVLVAYLRPEVSEGVLTTARLRDGHWQGGVEDRALPITAGYAIVATQLGPTLAYVDDIAAGFWRWSGSGWTELATELPVTPGGDAYSLLAASADPEGRPWIAVRDGVEERCRFFRHDGAAFIEQASLAGAHQPAGWRSSNDALRFDGQGAPYFVSMLQEEENWLVVHRLDGAGVWQQLGERRSLAGGRAQLELDSQDRPWLAYDLDNLEVRLARLEGDTWTEEIPAVRSVGWGNDFTLALDAQDRPAVAFETYEGMEVHAWGGDEWAQQGAVLTAHEDGEVYDSSLVIPAGGRPVVLWIQEVGEARIGNVQVEFGTPYLFAAELSPQ